MVDLVLLYEAMICEREMERDRVSLVRAARASLGAPPEAAQEKLARGTSTMSWTQAVRTRRRRAT